MASFTEDQWNRVHSHLDANEAKYGLPEHRAGSLVFSSFNIRKFGALKSRGKIKRSAGSWKLLIRFAKRCDFLAVQEVGDDLTSVRHLVEQLGDDFAFMASDISGGSPGAGGNIERLVFVYRKSRIEPTGLGTDLTYERSDIYRTLYDRRDVFDKDLDLRDEQVRKYEKKVEAWEVELAHWEATGLNANGKPKKPKKPGLEAMATTEFVQFIRSPHMASFKTVTSGNEKPYRFIAVNAHLLYGGNTTIWKGQRLREFKALMDWLVLRAQKMERMFEPNFILFGDLNLDFEKIDLQREAITKYLKTLNGGDLSSGAKINMPFLDSHPALDKVFRTNARHSQTFDHIAIIASDREYPPPHQNDEAGKSGPDKFDFGMFDFTQLFFDVVPEATTQKQKRWWYHSFEFDVSDHMPIWIRLEKPHVGQHQFRWR